MFKAMNCKEKKIYLIIAGLVGAATCAFGLVGMFGLPETVSAGNDMFMGYCTGFGGTLLLISVVCLIVNALTPKDKQKEQMIEATDERNVLIRRSSCCAAYFAAIICDVIMAFVFIGLGYVMPALIAIGSMYVTVITLLVAQCILRKKI